MRKFFRNWNFLVKANSGLTYIEVIIVLTIFLMITAISLGNYNDFQSNIEIRNLTSDVALSIMEAQRSSVTGKLAPSGYSPISDWKPAYGVYFNNSNVSTENKFVFFIDLDNDGQCDGGCGPSVADYSISGEVIDIISMRKGNKVADAPLGIKLSDNNSVACMGNVEDINIVFKRPDPRPVFLADGILCDIYSANITIISPSGEMSRVVADKSGRIYIE